MNKDTRDPAWWSEEHTSAWERVKAAFKRDWEQTKHDLTRSKGRDLDQDVPDTVKQAVGAEPIPEGGRPNAKRSDDEDWERIEQPARFGFGARRQFDKDGEWNDQVETRLRDEWNKLGTSERWEQARARVQSGWERAKPGDFRS
jgi:hypothetical protein